MEFLEKIVLYSSYDSLPESPIFIGSAFIEDSLICSGQLNLVTS